MTSILSFINCDFQLYGYTVIVGRSFLFFSLILAQYFGNEIIHLHTMYMYMIVC